MLGRLYLFFLLPESVKKSSGFLLLLSGNRVKQHVWKYMHMFGLTSIPAYVSNCIRYKVWDETTYPFPNFNGTTVEIWEWIDNSIPCDYFFMEGLKLNLVGKMSLYCLLLWFGDSQSYTYTLVTPLTPMPINELTPKHMGYCITRIHRNWWYNHNKRTAIPWTNSWHIVCMPAPSTGIFCMVEHRQASNISHALVCSDLVDHSDVVRASPAAAAPTTSSFPA